MATPKEVRELAAEITLSLISITPGVGQLSKLLPDTAKKAVRTAYGVKNADTLEKAVEQTLNAVTADILGEAEPGTNEYGAAYSAITDFHSALKATTLDARLITAAILEPRLLEEAISANTPKEHLEWASSLCRRMFESVLQRFAAAIIALAPQVPAVAIAIAIETYRQVSELRATLLREESKLAELGSRESAGR